MALVYSGFQTLTLIRISNKAKVSGILSPFHPIPVINQLYPDNENSLRWLPKSPLKAVDIARQNLKKAWHSPNMEMDA